MISLKPEVNLTKDNWHKQSFVKFDLFFKGKINSLPLIEQCLEKHDIDFDIFERFLKKQRGSFSIVIVTNHFILAAVDRMCSFPLFFTKSAIMDHMVYDAHAGSDKDALLEYFCSGFVSGQKTLNSQSKRLEAGEYLYFVKSGVFEVRPYFRYVPVKNLGRYNEEDYLEQFGQLTDQSIERTLASANGRKILVPLSGGLDSRLILAKLVEAKYDNLHVITYGVKDGHESIMARNVCDKLRLKWNFIPTSAVNLTADSFKEYFNRYLSFCALPSSVPSILEVLAFYQLSQAGAINDAVIVNGQSGDFTSGGHIRFDLIGELTRDNLYRYMLKKHYSLWPRLLTESNVSNILKIIDKEFVKFCQFTGDDDLISFYEYWECKERQSKIVLNGQRLYDSMGCYWTLPFWDSDLLDFWRSCPIKYKLNQSLYIKYLKSYNYAGLFDTLRIVPDPWVSKYSVIRYLGFITKLTLGNKFKALFYKYMDYYSTYNDQYRILGRDLYKQHWREIRNPVSLMVLLSLGYMEIDANSLFNEIAACVS